MTSAINSCTGSLSFLCFDTDVLILGGAETGCVLSRDFAFFCGTTTSLVSFVVSTTASGSGSGASSGLVSGSGFLFLSLALLGLLGNFSGNFSVIENQSG